MNQKPEVKLTVPQQKIVEFLKKQKTYLDSVNTMVSFLEQSKKGLLEKTFRTNPAFRTPEDYNFYLESLKKEQKSYENNLKTMAKFFKHDAGKIATLGGKDLVLFIENTMLNKPTFAENLTNEAMLPKLNEVSQTIFNNKESTATSIVNYNNIFIRDLQTSDKFKKLWAEFMGKNPGLKRPTFSDYAIEHIQIGAGSKLMSEEIATEIAKEIFNTNPNKAQEMLNVSVQDLFKIQDKKLAVLEAEQKAIIKEPRSSANQKLIDILKQKIAGEEKTKKDLTALNDKLQKQKPDSLDENAKKSQVKQVIEAFKNMGLALTGFSLKDLQDKGLKINDNDQEVIETKLDNLRAKFDNEVFTHLQNVFSDINRDRKVDLGLFSFLMQTKGVSVFSNIFIEAKKIPLEISNLKSRLLSGEEKLDPALETAIRKFAKKSYEKIKDHAIIPITTQDPVKAIKQIKLVLSLGLIPNVQNTEIFKSFKFPDKQSNIEVLKSPFYIDTANANVAIDQYQAILKTPLTTPEFTNVAMGAIDSYLKQPIQKMREKITLDIITDNPTLAKEQIEKILKRGLIPKIVQPGIFKSEPIPVFDIRSKKRSVCAEQIKAVAASGGNFTIKDPQIQAKLPQYLQEHPRLRRLGIYVTALEGKEKETLYQQEKIKQFQQALNLGFAPRFNEPMPESFQRVAQTSAVLISSSDSNIAIEQIRGAFAHGLNVMFDPKSNIADNIRMAHEKKIVSPDSAPQKFYIYIHCTEGPEALKRMHQATKLGFTPKLDAASREALFKYQRDAGTVFKYLSYEAQRREAQGRGKEKAQDVQLEREAQGLGDKHKAIIKNLALSKNVDDRIKELQLLKNVEERLIQIPITTTNIELAKQQIKTLMEQGLQFKIVDPKIETLLKSKLANEEITINIDAKNVIPMLQKALDIGFIPKLAEIDARSKETTDTKRDFFAFLKADKESANLPRIQVNLTKLQDPVKVVQAIVDVGAIPIWPNKAIENKVLESLKTEQNIIQIKEPKDNPLHVIRLFEALVNMGFNPKIDDALQNRIRALAVHQEPYRQELRKQGEVAALQSIKTKKQPQPKAVPLPQGMERDILPSIHLNHPTFNSVKSIIEVGLPLPFQYQEFSKASDKQSKNVRKEMKLGLPEYFIQAIVSDLKKQFDANPKQNKFTITVAGESKKDPLYIRSLEEVLLLNQAIQNELQKGNKKYKMIALEPVTNEKIAKDFLQARNLASKTGSVAQQPMTQNGQKREGQGLRQEAPKRPPPPPARKKSTK